MNNILNDFRKKVCEKIDIQSRGKNRYLIISPFYFNDGDMFKIILKKEKDKWHLTDEGHTIMHLSYDNFEITSEKRVELLNKALAKNCLECYDGEIVTTIENNDFGDSLFSFIQGIMQISDLEYLSQEQVRKIFFEDLNKLMNEMEKPFEKDYIYSRVDKKGTYQIDYKIDLPKEPIHIFGANTDEKCRIIAINCYYLLTHGIKFFSIVVLEHQEEISRRALTQLTDAVDKQFATFDSAKSDLAKYIRKIELMQS